MVNLFRHCSMYVISALDFVLKIDNPSFRSLSSNTWVWWISLVLFSHLVLSPASNDTPLCPSLCLRSCQKICMCSWMHDPLSLNLFIYYTRSHSLTFWLLVFHCRNTSAGTRAISCLWFYWLRKKHFKSREILGAGEK